GLAEAAEVSPREPDSCARDRLLRRRFGRRCRPTAAPPASRTGRRQPCGSEAHRRDQRHDEGTWSSEALVSDRCERERFVVYWRRNPAPVREDRRSDRGRESFGAALWDAVVATR